MLRSKNKFAILSFIGATVPLTVLAASFGTPDTKSVDIKFQTPQQLTHTLVSESNLPSDLKEGTGFASGKITVTVPAIIAYRPDPAKHGNVNGNGGFLRFSVKNNGTDNGVPLKVVARTIPSTGDTTTGWNISKSMESMVSYVLKADEDQKIPGGIYTVQMQAAIYTE